MQRWGGGGGGESKPTNIQKKRDEKNQTIISKKVAKVLNGKDKGEIEMVDGGVWFGVSK